MTAPPLRLRYQSIKPFQRKESEELWRARSPEDLTAWRARAAWEVRTAGERRREARHALSRQPERSALEREIGRFMHRMMPRELKQLANLVTAPQLTIALRLREVMKDIALGREGGE